MPPVPIYMKFYFFEIENPERVLAGLEAPILSERGPYSYLEYKRKMNVSNRLEGENRIR